MTQSVTFEFTSAQFILESGSIVFTKGARLRNSPDHDVGRVVNGALDDVLVEGPIDFDAVLHDLRLTRRADGRACAVPALWVTGTLAVDQIRSGRISVPLDLSLLLVFRVETSSGEPVPDTVLSIFQPSTEGCVAMTADENGELRMFARPGRYNVTTPRVWEGRLWDNSVDVTFEVAAGEQGERLIVLQIG